MNHAAHDLGPPGYGAVTTSGVIPATTTTSLFPSSPFALPLELAAAAPIGSGKQPSLALGSADIFEMDNSVGLVESSVGTATCGDVFGPAAVSNTHGKSATGPSVPVEKNVSPDQNIEFGTLPHVKDANDHLPVPPSPPNWSGLFSKLPKNAGAYVPRTFNKAVTQDGALIPPVEVIIAGTEFWKDHLVGFFLDSTPPSYDEVKRHCARVWHIRGGLHVNMDRNLYFFKFTSADERLRILSLEPTFIRGKPFLVTPWTSTIDSVRDRVLSVPVWTYFSNIPSVLQPLIGLDWLASNIGKLKCFDANTVERKKLVYAKALIEVTPGEPLPDTLRIRLADGVVAVIVVCYGWRPDICTSCQSFGHTIDTCSRLTSESAPVPLSARLPLPTPPVMRWIPKAIPDTMPTASTERNDTAIGQVFDVDSTPPTTAIVTDVAPLPTVEFIEPAPCPQHVPPVVWFPDDEVWIHTATDMRYNPAGDFFCSFVSDDADERRYLLYYISGDTLKLATDSPRGWKNDIVLADTTWDRSFLYSAESKNFDPALVSLFRPFIGTFPLSTEG